ncbi:nickel-responsive transcriptional regulator NikR [Lawsonia intracellularis]|uniref:Putative nickel-responsive regulator n=1 Tax=Lawsonia intracellularis (strain PHE/MN1-00) TaxID=363253 RepID=NIKR_LAWIP|nr:nickel-responsive transcriptional regulator NikR [Lawsonia intracellularis]Q1MPD3.1 RecName: Full=Putative nickel-responsive regulator [Lawsonia intracellularis PHE/MN1-00]AGC50526.1 nickel-responsive transcriptional regulator NikR [Lawsonia intracellularis N343]KAA0204544.1 nickel-responsive transcriptional regulator NikR [Lawsonia intracellularis]MBZ3892977.1 nickel-responsive transcriptional regulator NikR [Lawsonia intracellularis]OMQ02332.1 nickel responsive regulator [Lawsonia intrace
MGETVRFGVSLDEDLLNKFDKLCDRQGYPSRSEALRDMIRQALAKDILQSKDSNAAGVLSLVYDHHTRELSRKLIERQHEMYDSIIATLHIHLDRYNCLEVLIIKGNGGKIQQLADMLCSIRGVKLGAFSFLPVEEDVF